MCPSNVTTAVERGLEQIEEVLEVIRRQPLPREADIFDCFALSRGIESGLALPQMFGLEISDGFRVQRLTYVPRGRGAANIDGSIEKMGVTCFVEADIGAMKTAALMEKTEI